MKLIIYILMLWLLTNCATKQNTYDLRLKCNDRIVDGADTLDFKGLKITFVDSSCVVVDFNSEVIK